MKLFIKQKVFSWKDRFTVWDEQGNERYYVEGELLSWGKKLHLTDTFGNEVAYIKQEVLRWRPRFHIFMGGKAVAEIVREFSFFRPSYTVEGPGWTAEGNFWQHDYMVRCGERTVAEIYKQWMTWGDCYEIDIYDERDEALALAVVLVIDCVLAMQNNS